MEVNTENVRRNLLVDLLFIYFHFKQNLEKKNNLLQVVAQQETHFILKNFLLA